MGQPLTLGIELIDDPNWMGGTLYLQNLAICLSRLPAQERPHVRLLGSPEIVANFTARHGPLPGINSSPKSLLQRISQRLGLPQKQPPAIDVIYPGFGAQVPGAVTMRWIPDFQHRYLPELFSAEEIAARDASIGEIAEKPGVVVVSSQTAKDDFVRFYPDHRATPRVWHFRSLLTVGDLAIDRLRQTYNLPEKYLYLPNQFWVHKNHIAVFKALAQLRHDHGLTIPLVCTGATRDRRNEAHFAGLMSFVEDQGLADQIQFLGLIDRADQVGILRCAAAVVQPSRFEGWSTVVEDVRAVGRPIFLSDLPVHREQAPPHCVYFSPEDSIALAKALQQGWDDLLPGPDLAAERAAKQQVDQYILNSAHSFCNIARDAIALVKAH
ncbi:glycosyltransferase family 4 protein [Nodosilinea sp. PGN35]|uniref:glycosyltransferase family 4 protein n=1 Tax=Nodosilinea sp. PGN35 TaxID=3020489 RepID=UPI0023B2C13C|nr:glycosyltransferase family 1 protein [Nodosilinea sp. TSF1-S3]MDF0367612.1 glycosyltransferase family 1 protein [Nodosilinea sp. TSF1-S3]